jgi:hypothetical protein
MGNKRLFLILFIILFFIEESSADKGYNQINYNYIIGMNILREYYKDKESSDKRNK